MVQAREQREVENQQLLAMKQRAASASARKIAKKEETPQRPFSLKSVELHEQRLARIREEHAKQEKKVAMEREFHARDCPATVRPTHTRHACCRLSTHALEFVQLYWLKPCRHVVVWEGKHCHKCRLLLDSSAIC
jgi:hypothetical protein